jgi:hypothetical protein
MDGRTGQANAACPVFYYSMLAISIFFFFSCVVFLPSPSCFSVPSYKDNNSIKLLFVESLFLSEE